VTQLNAGPIPATPPQVRPGADLYTVLLIVATALLAAGTILLAVRSQQLFGSLWPPSGG
jgi:hypothetical protein